MKNTNEQQKAKLLKSTLYYYIGSYMLPLSSMLGFILADMSDSSLIYNLGIALHLVALYIFGIRTTYLANYSDKSLYEISGRNLDIFRFLTLFLLLGLLLFYKTSYTIIGFIFFCIGIVAMSILTSSLDNFRIKAYNLYDNTTLLIKKDINYTQLGLLLSATLGVITALLAIEEFYKYIILIIIFLFFMTLSRINTPKIRHKTKEGNLSYKEYLLHLKDDYCNYSDQFKYYIKSNVCGNVGNVMFLQVVFLWRRHSDITLLQLASVYLGVKILSYTLSFFTPKFNFSPYSAIRIFRSVSVIRIILIMILPKTLPSLILLYIIGSNMSVFLSIGKKDINSYFTQDTLEPEEVNTLNKIFQGASLFFITLLAGFLQDVSVYGLIIFGIFEIFINILSVHYLNKSEKGGEHDGTRDTKRNVS